MENFRRELRRVKRFEVSYYKDLIDTIERYVSEKPDISIETCKALLEGMSKLILGEIQQKKEVHFKDANGNYFSVGRLFKEARECLKSELNERNEGAMNKGGSEIVYDDSLVSKYGGIANILSQLMPTEAIARIGMIRNDHSDISHGRTSLKEQVNDEDLAELIISITGAVCTYMLRKLDQVTDKEVLYDDNIEFNNSLDEQYSLDGTVLYSKALFEQEFETYKIRLGDYLIEQENEIEEL